MGTLAIQIGLLTGVWSAFTAAIWRASDRADKLAAEEARRSLTAWLKRPLGSVTSPEFGEYFANLFETVFTKRHLSFKCFIRSSLASAIALAAVAASTVVLVVLIRDPLMYSGTDPIEIIIFVVLLFLIIYGLACVFPDYLSLLETRMLLNLLRRGRIGLVKAVSIDMLLTLTIALLATLPVVLGVNWLGETRVAPGEFLAMMVFTIPTGFVTSLWLWLFIGANVLIRSEALAGIVHSRMQRLLNIEEKPFGAIGVYTNLIVFICYVLGIVIVLVLHLIRLFI